MQNRRYKITLIAALMILIITYTIWKTTSNKPTFNKQGYGGYTSSQSKNTNSAKQKDPLQPAFDAYNSGNYKKAETYAQQIVDTMSQSKDLKQRNTSVRARKVLAFSAARRKDLKLAQERFAVMKTEASKLPDKGKQEPEIGKMEPTLTEDAAYQHAVCTSALGDKKAAEAEYFKFMSDYPESPLVYGASQRIRMLHGGRITKELDKAFAQAMKVAKDRQMTRMKEASRCGPECLAELLKRKGTNADVSTLAKEMKSDEMGTTLQSLSDIAKKHGFTPKGLELTQKGLIKQQFPLIALVAPGHYVIVEKASMNEVTIWDSNMVKAKKPALRDVPIKEWSERWKGIVLALG